MSNVPYYKKASKQKAADPTSDTPQVNRFHDVRKIDRRRHEVLDYMMMGFEAEEIADYLDVSVDTIKDDIASIIETGYQAREEEVVQIRDELLRTYRQIRKEGFRGFKLSQGTVETITAEFGEGGDGRNGQKEPEKMKVKTEHKAGDANLLRAAIDANKEIGKVSGAQKHKEVEIQQNINQSSTTILSPNRSELPSDFDKWLRKPEGEDLPDDAAEVEIESKDVEVEQ